jgi:hypothetical protein
MRGGNGSRRRRESERHGFDPHKWQMQKRRRRCNEDAGMDDSLAERTIGRVIGGMCFAMRGRLRRGDFNAIAETLRAVMDMRLGDVRLKCKGKGSYEYDNTPRRAHAPHSRRFRSRSRHEIRNRHSSLSLCRIGYGSATIRNPVP